MLLHCPIDCPIFLKYILYIHWSIYFLQFIHVVCCCYSLPELINTAGYNEDVLYSHLWRYGFVEFDDPRDADDAVYDLNGKDLCGERVIVEHTKGPRRDGSYGSGRSKCHRRLIWTLGFVIGLLIFSGHSMLNQHCMPSRLSLVTTCAFASGPFEWPECANM